MLVTFSRRNDVSGKGILDELKTLKRVIWEFIVKRIATIKFGRDKGIGKYYFRVRIK